MPEEPREGGHDGRLVNDSDDIIDADDRHQKEISEAAQKYLKKLRSEPIVVVP